MLHRAASASVCAYDKGWCFLKVEPPWLDGVEYTTWGLASIYI